MALIQCYECTKEISDKAPTCPHCGAPASTPPPVIPPPRYISRQPPQRRSVLEQIVRGVGVTFLIFFCVFLLLVGWAAYEDATKKAKIPAARINPKEEVRTKVQIDRWSWRKVGFDNVMEADFTIVNNSEYNIKDITIKCTHSAASGTEIDSNTRTIYEIVGPGERKEFKNFNMGFIHTQAKSSAASIIDLTIAGR